MKNAKKMTTATLFGFGLLLLGGCSSDEAMPAKQTPEVVQAQDVANEKEKTINEKEFKAVMDVANGYLEQLKSDDYKEDSFTSTDDEIRISLFSESSNTKFRIDDDQFSFHWEGTSITDNATEDVLNVLKHKGIELTESDLKTIGDLFEDGKEMDGEVTLNGVQYDFSRTYYNHVNFVNDNGDAFTVVFYEFHDVNANLVSGINCYGVKFIEDVPNSEVIAKVKKNRAAMEDFIEVKNLTGFTAKSTSGVKSVTYLNEDCIDLNLSVDEGIYLEWRDTFKYEDGAYIKSYDETEKIKPLLTNVTNWNEEESSKVLEFIQIDSPEEKGKLTEEISYTSHTEEGKYFTTVTYEIKKDDKKVVISKEFLSENSTSTEYKMFLEME